MDITKLQLVIKAIGDASRLFSDVSHGFSLSEISEVLALAADAKMILAEAGQVIPEWEALDDSSRKALSDFVTVNVKFPVSVSAEAYVQKVLKAVISMSAIFQVWNS